MRQEANFELLTTTSSIPEPNTQLTLMSFTISDNNNNNKK